MKRVISLLPIFMLCALLLSSCMATGNPLVKAEATPVPGIPLELHTASAAEGNTAELEATLYFRFMDSGYLAPERRRLTVQKDESNEMAVLKALLEGPSAEKIELRRLLENDISVVSISEATNTLFITFNDAFLSDGIPADWQTQENWREEAPLRRLLTLQSIANTMTDNFPCASVQMMISHENDAQAGTRLDRGYLLNGQTGPIDPLPRDESFLLTSYNTVSLLLQAWQERDYETLYTFTAAYADRESRPVYERLLGEIDASHALTEYAVSAGSVTEDGQHATHVLTLRLLHGGKEESVDAYPLRLVRENGIWKITYSSLKRLMLP